MPQSRLPCGCPLAVLMGCSQHPSLPACKAQKYGSGSQRRSWPARDRSGSQRRSLHARDTKRWVRITAALVAWPAPDGGPEPPWCPSLPSAPRCRPSGLWCWPRPLQPAHAAGNISVMLVGCALCACMFAWAQQTQQVAGHMPVAFTAPSRHAAAELTPGPWIWDPKPYWHAWAVCLALGWMTSAP